MHNWHWHCTVAKVKWQTRIEVKNIKASLFLELVSEKSNGEKGEAHSRKIYCSSPSIGEKIQKNYADLNVNEEGKYTSLSLAINFVERLKNVPKN